MKHIFFLALIVILSVSCADNPANKNSKYTEFEKTVDVTPIGQKIPPIMLYPRNMFLCDSFLVVYNDKMDTLFQVYDKHTLEYRYSFGIIGGGPNDFRLLSSYLVGSNGKEALVQDLALLKSISMKNGHPLIKSVRMPVAMDYYNGTLLLEDSVFVCNADFADEEEFMFLYPDGEVKKWGNYPETTERFGQDAVARHEAYSTLTVARPEGDRFAAFYSYIRQFRIFDSKGKLLKKVELDIMPREQELSVEPEKRYIHPIALFATNEHIYALNLDMTPEEIYARKRYPTIQVFSWDGKPLVKYNLNCMISTFTVDEANGIIYGAFAEQEDLIYKFHI